MKREKIFTIILLSIVLLIGFLLRIWDFGSLPAGLHQDEASIAVEASSLYHFGEDRNGEAYPVHFIAWGSGQNALYGYLLVPLVPLGMTPTVIRLPMLITGLASILLMYFIGRKVFSPATGILAAALMAISPWHIMLSRWALESNILPFVFLLGFLFAIHFDRGWLWVTAACVFLGISLYAYGTAYLLVPLFLVWLFAIVLSQHRYSWWQLGIGLLLFLAIAFPIGLFILVNSFSLPGMHIGPVSIPRLPADPRYEVLTGIRHGGTLVDYLKNFYSLVRILFLQTDGLIYNGLPAFGFLFPGAVLFALAGTGRILQNWKNARSPQVLLFLGWAGLAFLLGIVQPPVINRINVLFPALILLVAWCLEGLWHQGKLIFSCLTLGMAISTCLFAREYFLAEGQTKAGLAFNEGFIQALQQIPAQTDLPVCVTSTVNMPYIYVLLLHPEDPAVIALNIQYETPRDAFRVVDRLGKYYFGSPNCPDTSRQYRIAQRGGEALPDAWAGLFTMKEYGDFDLYIPKTQ